ncbi:MAG: biopolymer transporter ExbD [Gammaproteobacteria bacterium]|nr:MAG: biopolymer transporter ExbD [Gammaproteobacteria bacterium]
MRERTYRQPEPPQAIDLTPMLDVVFILLIFFIVTATFIREPGVEVERTAAVTEQQRNPAILVAVTADNGIWIDGRKVSADSLRLHILRLRNENPRGGLVIQADREADMATLTRVADVARAAGIVDVSVSTGER